MGEREEFDEMYEAPSPREQVAMKASMALLVACMLGGGSGQGMRAR